jgi:hypothetical protein
MHNYFRVSGYRRTGSYLIYTIVDLAVVFETTTELIHDGVVTQ